MINIDSYLELKREQVNSRLLLLMPAGAPAVINAAMRYNVDAGGKRLRPVLTLATAESLGSLSEDLLNVACAVEMIHTYSLIHDDLPAMDNSDLRRGAPTCHRVYGEAVAVLTGDAFLTLAFETIARYGSVEGNAERASLIAAELADAAGTRGMIGGQILDLLAEGRDLTINEVDNIAAMKTGALIKAAVCCGALAAGATAGQYKKLEYFARSVGKAFQIIDDLFDYQESADGIGKPVGIDQIVCKATYPALLGIEKAREKAEQLYAESLAILDQLDCPTDLLKALAHKLVYRKK